MRSAARPLGREPLAGTIEARDESVLSQHSNTSALILHLETLKAESGRVEIAVEIILASSSP
jgi:hypothetical protein